MERTNLQRIAQNSPNSPTLCMNHAKFAQSTPISQDSLPPVVKLSKFTTFAHFCNFSEIRTIRLVRKLTQAEANNTKFAPFHRVFHLSSRKAKSTPCLSELRENRNLQLQFAKYQFLHNFHLPRTH